MEMILATFSISFSLNPLRLERLGFFFPLFREVENFRLRLLNLFMFLNDISLMRLIAADFVQHGPLDSKMSESRELRVFPFRKFLWASIRPIRPQLMRSSLSITALGTFDSWPASLMIVGMQDSRASSQEMIGDFAFFAWQRILSSFPIS